MKPFAITLATALLALTLSQPSLAVTYTYDAAGNMLALVSTPPEVTDHALSVQLQGAGSGKVTGPSIDCGSSSSANFAPSSSGNLTMPFVLTQGWNLLGNSLSQPLAVNPTLSNPAVVNTVWKWDVAAGGWQFYTPAMDAAALQTYAISKNYGVLSVINPGEGYWVYAKAPADLASQTGTSHTLVATDLAQGWNLVTTGNAVPPTPSAFNSALSATPPTPGSVPLNLTTLWAWDTAASNWYFYAPSLEASGGLAAYIASKGYLDFTAASKTLGNGVGFWVNKP